MNNSVMNNGKSLLCGLCTLLLWSCSTDDNASHTDPIPAEIIISTGFGSASGVPTRGAGIVNPSDISDRGRVLPVSVARIDQTTVGGDFFPYDDITPVSGYLSPFDESVQLRFTDGEYYLPLNIGTALVGWHPTVGDGVVFSVNTSEATVEFAIDGDSDILLSDVLLGSANSPFDQDGTTMNFYHLLTQLRVKVYGVDAGVEEEWGGVTVIEVMDTPTGCTVTLPDLNASGVSFPISGKDITYAFASETGHLPLIQKDPFSSTEAIKVLDYGVGNPLTIPDLSGEAESTIITDAALTGYAMVAPIDDTGTLTLRVSTSEQDPVLVDIPFPENGEGEKAFPEGYYHTIYLEFSDSGIRPGITIAPWDKGNEEDVELW